MKIVIAALAFALAGWVEKSPEQETPLVVHEWGTFTSFSDPKGELIQFRPLVDNRLPAFVVTRSEQLGGFDPELMLTKFTVWSNQRMETPVTYFYTDHARDVNVSVGFPKGYLTEFYPPVRAILPRAGDEAPLQNAQLDWGRVRLIPQDEFDSTIAVTAQREGRNALPIAPGDNHYSQARATDSAVVEFSEPAGRGTHYEKFLFYRGLGNFDQPGNVTASGAGKFVFHNTSEQELKHLFLLDVDGFKVRFSSYPSVAPKSDLAMETPTQYASVEEAAEALVKSLVETGLYEKEAEAMVNTWRSSWFGETGVRVLYVTPQMWTDELVPIHIDPAPAKLVRVMVGRQEIMTPELQQDLVKLVQAQSTPEQVVADAPNNAVGRLGRFGGAAMYHIAHQFGENEAVKERAGQIANGILQEEDSSRGNALLE